MTDFGLFTIFLKIFFNKLPLLATKFDSKKDWKFFTNNKNTLKHNVIKNYRIINTGFRKEGMEKEIAYGLFYR